MTNNSLSPLVRLGRALSRVLLFKASHLLAWVAGLAIMLMTLITFITVIGRRAQISAAWLSGGYETSELLMSVVSVFALAYCWYIGGHIRISVIRDRCRPRIQAALDLISAFLIAATILVIIWGLWILSTKTLDDGLKTWCLNIPIGPFQVLLTLVLAHFALVMFRSAWGFFDKVRGRDVEHGGFY